MSPIRASERARYPKDWKRIRATILMRAVNGEYSQCECEGECGLHRDHPGPRRCVEIHGAPAMWAKGRICLTVAHLNHTPEDNRPENLRAWCQRCHLRYDAAHHAANARETRARKKLESQPTFAGVAS